MRKPIVLLASLVILAMGARESPVGAAQPECRPGKDGSAVGCGGGTVVITPGGPGQPAKRVATGKRSKSSARYVSYRRIKEGPDGTLCQTVGYRLVPPGGDPADYSLDDPVFRGEATVTTYPPCPRAAAAGAPEPALPSELALSFWDEVPLPEPDPHIAPGRAITGLDAFLETNGLTEASFSQDTPLGPMRIDATGTYEVAWGDGTTAGPFPYEGAPWPDGDIVHRYQRVGRYDIVVTERWVATWTLGTESGVLSELRTSATIADFPVEQIQSVVGR